MKISVIIPTYNREKILPRAIHSALNQTYPVFEVIVVDDNSSDNTEKIVTSIADKRVKYIKKNINGGAASARNVGIKNARGEIVALLDSDDEWYPEKIEKQLNLFKKSNLKNLGLVSCLRLDVDADGKVINKSKTCFRGDVTKELLAGWMVHYNIINSSIAFIKRSVFNEVGLFDETLKDHEDYDFWLRASQCFEYECVNEHLAKCYKWKTVARMSESEYFQNKKAFLSKNISTFKKYPSIYSKKCFWLGRYAIEAGHYAEGYAFLFNSFSAAPFTITALKVLVVAIFTPFKLFLR